MKKIVYVVAVAAFAALMVACSGNGVKSTITKGNSSKMDSLSYAFGVNIANDMQQQMVGVKFDWDTMIKSMEEAMMKDVEATEDKAHEEALAVLQTFFTNTGRERMMEFQQKQIEADSLGQTVPDIKDFDIFVDDEERATISEAFGCDVGSNLRASRLPLQTYWFSKAIKDAIAGTPQIPVEQVSVIIEQYYSVVLPKQNAEASEKWLAQIEKKSGVKKTDSGLLYRIDRAGDESLKPRAEDIVKVDYEGKLRSGQVFDSSYERGEPTEFPLNAVIPGWTEGVQLIGKGGQITLWIPANLAYGPMGAGGLIGPNEALEFKVELHEIKSSAEAAAPAASETPAE